MSRGGARLNSGRPRKTAAQHELESTVPAKLNPLGPRYSVDAPDKPDYIAANAIAAAEWDRVVPLLIEQRVITHAFPAALENYCSSYADVVAGEQAKAQPEFSPSAPMPEVQDEEDAILANMVLCRRIEFTSPIGSEYLDAARLLNSSAWRPVY